MWTRSGWTSISPSMFVYRTPVAPTDSAPLSSVTTPDGCGSAAVPAIFRCASKLPVTSVIALVNPCTTPRLIGLLSTAKSIRAVCGIRCVAAEQRGRQISAGRNPLRRVLLQPRVDGDAAARVRQRARERVVLELPEAALRDVERPLDLRLLPGAGDVRRRVQTARQLRLAQQQRIDAGEIDVGRASREARRPGGRRHLRPSVC